jgi:FkbM family methyltransferase
MSLSAGTLHCLYDVRMPRVRSAIAASETVKSPAYAKVPRLSRLSSSIKRRLGPLLGRVFDLYAQRSYSQEGEDMILRRVFEGQASGFYVDVGAHHPQRFSNTNFFYRRGWSGINIEPNPDAARIFRSSRHRDINLQLGVSNEPGTLKYFVFDESALNTFDESMVASRLAHTPYRLVGTIDVRVETLDSILSRHVPAGRVIDFLSIDVEGLDFAVLKSNDWQQFRPRVVLVEALGSSLQKQQDGEVARFMAGVGYELVAKTFNTLFFRTSL